MKTKIDTLRDNKNNVIAMYEDGYSTIKISKKYGCSPALVSAFLNKECDVKMRQSFEYGRTKDQLGNIINMYKNHMTIYAIAKKTGISRTQVNRLLRNRGFDTSMHKSNHHEVPLVEYTDEIISKFKSGISCIKIAKDIGFSVSKVWQLLKNNNIDTNVHQYSVDEHFFDTLDTEEKCYIFGLWLADGCVTDKGSIILSMTDKDIIYKIKHVLKYEGPVRFRKRRMPHHKDQYQLSIGRKYMADQLIAKGCVPRKSLILKFPSEDDFETRHLNSLVRGYFDGDGCLDKTLNQLCIVGSVFFIDRLAEYLKNMDISCRFSGVSRTKHKCTKQLWIRTIQDRIKFLDWLYKDSTIHLDRKYQKYLELKAKFTTGG